MNFSIDFTGDALSGAQFALYEARAMGVLELAAEAIKDDFHAIEARRFGNQGPGWEPLTATTIAIKTRKGMPQPSTAMYGTGELMFSLTGETDHSVFHVTPEEIVVGTTVPYAKYHQIGPRQIKVFGRGSARLPQRKVVDLTEADLFRWVAIVSTMLWGSL